MANIVELKGHKNAILDLCWTSNHQILSCSADKTAVLWDLATAKKLRSFKDHTGPINSISSVDEMILTAGDDMTVRLWDFKSKNPINKLEIKYQITSVALTEEYAFYGGVDNSIKAWNLLSGNFSEFSLLGHKDTITGIKLS